MPTLDEIEAAFEFANSDYFAPEAPAPEATVDEMLARWCRVETAAFAADESARNVAEAPVVEAKPEPKPAANVVTIATGRGTDQYKVTPFTTSWGRGFTLQKINTKKPASYDVLIGVNGEPDCCDCGAATFSSHKPCKHVMACKKLIADGGINVPAKPPVQPRRNSFLYPESI
jgi:hypothetical protein